MICGRCKTILSEEEEKESNELDWGKVAFCPVCREILDKENREERQRLNSLKGRLTWKDYGDDDV